MNIDLDKVKLEHELFKKSVEVEAGELIAELNKNYIGVLKEFGIADLSFLSELKRQAKKECKECWEIVFSYKVLDFIRVSNNSRHIANIDKLLGVVTADVIEIFDDVYKKDLILSFEDVAEILEVSVDTVEKYTSLRYGKEKLPYYKPEKKRYVLLNELLEWMKKHRVKV